MSYVTVQTTISIEDARRIHAEASADGLVRVVAYAEAMAILLAGLDVHVGVPEALVRQALDDTLTGVFPWSPLLGGVGAHLERHVRARLSSALLAAGRQRGRLRDPWAARLARAQVGDLRGLELVAHHAGEMAATFRSGDRDVRAAADRLAAHVSTCVATFLEDTAPIPVAVSDDRTPRHRGDPDALN